MWIVDVCIRRPVFAVMLIGSLVLLGLLGFRNLGVDLFPKVEFPYVSVTTRLEGASPETIETEVTDVLEEYINNISGIEKLRSTSSEGFSVITIEFKLEENADLKAQEVRDKVALARAELPRDTDASTVEKVDPDAAPILNVLIAGQQDIRTLSEYADDVVRERLQRIPGVGSISLVGSREREIRVWLDALKLRANSLTADDVVRGIEAEHAELPGGRIEMSGRGIELGLRTNAEAVSIAELAALVVRFNDNAPPTRLRDVALVEDGLEDERSHALLDGERGVALEVRRQSGMNTVEVARRIKEEIAALQPKAPEGVRLIITRDISRFIVASVTEVTKELQLAMLLVVGITFFFLLNWRATLIVAVAIPSSLIATFFLFDVADYTLNILTLLALTVAIGLLVDDAIVVVEAVQTDVNAGVPPMEAASSATRRVSLAVLAGTFATLAVFVPIAFMEGIVGQFFREYGLTIVFSVSVSLLVALTLSPMLCSRYLRRFDHASTAQGPLGWIESFHRATTRAYASIIRTAMRYRYLVFLLAAGSIVLGAMIAARVPSGFTSKADRSEFQGQIELPTGIGVDHAVARVRAIDAVIRPIRFVESLFITIGAGSAGQPNRIELYGALTGKAERDVSQFTVMDEIRDAVRRTVPEARTVNIAEVPWVSGGGVSTADIELILQGPNLEQVRVYADQLVAALAESPGLSDVRSGYEPGRPELVFDVDRERAADLGVSARVIASTSRILVGGQEAATFESQGSRYPIRVRLREGDRQSIEHIEQLQVRSRSGDLVDIASVVDLDFRSGPARIERQDRTRKVSVFANAASDVALGDATQIITDVMMLFPPPTGVDVVMEGQARRMRESGASIAMALVLALVALYVVLASQFDSFSQPLVIMLSAPLCFSGAFAGLFLSGMEMSLFAQIGLVALMGIVMKNGILLVDRANQLRAEGADAFTAMANAGPERLRPVLMTAFAAIFGMIPVLLSNADGSEWRNAMGALLIGGLSSSTLLTLIVVPAAYLVGPDVHRAVDAVKRLVSGKSASRAIVRRPTGSHADL